MSDPTRSDTGAAHDTSRCPCGPRCEVCGVDADGLAVVTGTTDLGVICLTACPRCATSPVPPPITVTTAANFVRQHGDHVGGRR